MIKTHAGEKPIEDFGQLLRRLGVPAKRVRLHPPPGTAKEADVLKAMEAPRKRLCELVDGTLVEKPMGMPESRLTGYLHILLGGFVLARNLGVVSLPDGTMRLWPGLVRMPDLAFTSWERIPNRRLPNVQVPTLSPDWCIEILSPSNTAREMKRKRGEYFKVGTRLVWQVDPRRRIVEVFTEPDRGIIFRESQTLTAAPLLPGFSLSLRKLFGELDRHG